jgi:two-component sensor histidine kinase
MKKALKLIVLAILIIYVIGRGLVFLEYNFAKKTGFHGVRQIDIDTKELITEKISAILFYSDRIDIFSSQNKQLVLLDVGIKTKCSFFKNGDLIKQNYNPYLKGYTDKFYMKIPIQSRDYNEDNVCKIEFEVVPSLKNSNNRLFIGDMEKIDEFINFMYIIKTIVISTTIVAFGMSMFMGNRRKDIYLMLVGPFMVLSLFYFNIGLSGAVVSLAFTNVNILRKREKMLCFIIVLIISLLLKKNLYFLTGLLCFKIYDIVKKHGLAGIFSMMFLGGIYAVNNFERFNPTKVLMVFYKEIYLIIFIIFIISYSVYYFTILSRKYDNNVSVDLLRGISHDFKIPLSIIKLNTEISAEGFSTEGKRNSMQASTNNAIKDLERMIGSLTIYLSKNNYVHKEFNTSVKESIEKTERNFKNYDENINFEVSYDYEDVILPIDPVWFDRLIYNLVDNAFKYSDDTGRVILGYKKKKKYAIISVIDTGIGMTPDQLSKIFIPFYRADKSRSISGLGLGLSVIKNIVDSINGKIKVISKVGEGTTVIIEVKGK